MTLPQLWGVLYAQPNGNGERKACSNCRFASAAASPAGLLLGSPGAGGPVSRCAVLPVPITPEMVCGYHIETGGMADPELAGLETVPGGTSCDNCRFYEPEGEQVGRCLAVDDEAGEPAAVEAMGCCARWEAGEAEPADGMGY